LATHVDLQYSRGKNRWHGGQTTVGFHQYNSENI
jgi:hypothetical protein